MAHPQKTLFMTQTQTNPVRNGCCQTYTLMSHPQLALSAGPEAFSDVWQCSKGFRESWGAEQAEVQQDDPICPAGGNISQLPMRREWVRAGNQNNHHSILAHLTEMAGSAHSTQCVLEQDRDTYTLH